MYFWQVREDTASKHHRHSKGCERVQGRQLLLSGELATLKLGEKISFKDSRDRFRTMIVLEIVSPTRIRVGLERTVYLKEGLELHSI